jgi:hypothetical protein
MRDVKPLDRGERGFGVEMLHHDDGAADLMHRHRPTQRRRVIQRRRREIDHVGREPVQPLAEHHEWRDVGPERLVRQRVLDPLGLAGGARGIEQDAAG